MFLFNSRLKKIMAEAPEGCLFLERKGILVKYDGFPHVNLPANSDVPLDVDGYGELIATTLFHPL